MNTRHGYLLGALLICSCSGASIDVGPGAAGAAGAAPVGGGMSGGVSGAGGAAASLLCTDTTPIPSWPASTDCVATSDLPLVGTWHGYVETEGDPWDDLELVIAGASVNGLCGTLKLGNGPALPVVTDPSDGYPEPNSGADAAHGGVMFRAGVTHTLLQGKTDGARVRFNVASSEILKDWCAQQTAYAPTPTSPNNQNPDPTCRCERNLGSKPLPSNREQCELLDDMGESTGVVSCAHLELCQSLTPLCVCNQIGCVASQEGDPNSFDLRFDGDSAEGSDSLHSGRVFFTRAP